MISIIASSINTEQNILFRKNIEETIGVPYELIIHDNRETKWGLCKIYNHYACISKYDILCFFHEDILFQSTDWGKQIIQFFIRTPQAGAGGFAGSTIKTKAPSGWHISKDTTRINLIQRVSGNRIKKEIINPNNEEFSPVSLIDGLAIITTKKVWQQCPFDEKTFKDFHLYDLDFSMQTTQYYTNYVCHIIQIEHLSPGSYSKEWYNETLKFHEKWEGVLPVYAIPYSKKEKKRYEDLSSYLWTKRLLNNSWEQDKLIATIKHRLQLKTFNQIKYNFKLMKHLFRNLSKKRTNLSNS